VFQVRDIKRINDGIKYFASSHAKSVVSGLPDVTPIEGVKKENAS